MTLVDAIYEILKSHPEGLAPNQIKEELKGRYPEFYATESHQRSVERGHCHDLDHALLAQIYTSSRGGRFDVDRTQKPFLMTIVQEENEDPVSGLEIGTENLERLEAGQGTLYVLGTNVFTKDSEEIIKIGITTGDVEARISQLYTTGVPYRFRVIEKVDTTNYFELEQSLHKLLDPFRINRSREFFTASCLPYVAQVVSLHNQIQSRRG